MLSGIVIATRIEAVMNMRVISAPSIPLPRVASARLVSVGAVVFLANAGLLVLQLVAGRLLAPFVGSSLETWTSIIGAFLAGIAVGNAVGGRLADRHASRRLLAIVVACGGVAALWTVGFAELLVATGVHRSLPLGARIPILAAILCFPPGFILSLPTPLAFRLGLPDVRHAGRVAGLVFALSTLGCLVGNYVTGFYLIPEFTVNEIVFWIAGMLFIVAGVLFIAAQLTMDDRPAADTSEGTGGDHRGVKAVLSLRGAYLIVFLASFAGMTLELAGARLLAQVLGVSLYTWTGLIGVMLAGTATGNWLGGLLADRAAKSSDPHAGSFRLALCLSLAAIAVLLTWGLDYLVRSAIMERFESLDYVLYTGPLTLRVLVWTIALFFLPMFLLGTVSPQVIRLTVPDVSHAARVAGRVYAWSTVGAIVGTFATGFLLISELGMHRTILLAAALPVIAAVRAAKVWERPATLYTLSIVAGGVVAGLFLVRNSSKESSYYTIAVKETNYYTITVSEVWYGYDIVVRKLILDTLIHSTVMKDHPRYLEYVHEHTQVEFLQAVQARHPESQRVLVIGGGGYTFPRAARSIVPTSQVDVVEIDKGVTEIAYDHLFLDRTDTSIETYNMDGRQFVAERAERGHYHLVTLDAVNDLAVPSHLLTKEFNDAVKLTLTPDGVYLLTVIDHLYEGQLWRAAVHTLRKTFAHVELLTHYDDYNPNDRQVYVIYASDTPLDLGLLRQQVSAMREKEYGATQLHAAAAGAAGANAKLGELYTRHLPGGSFEDMLTDRPAVILTDQFAPVDYMMADVFSRRTRK